MLIRWLLKLRVKSLRQAPARAGALVLSVGGLFLAVTPYLLAGLRRISEAGTPEQARAGIASLFSYSFVFWALAGGLFHFHLAWQIDLPPLLRLPLRPWEIYRARLLYGLLGPWLIVFLPSWGWLAWHRAPSAGYVLPLFAALLLFAILCNQAAGILSLLKGRMTSGLPYLLALFAAFTLLNVTLFALLRSRITGDASTLARLGQTVARLQGVSASTLLPGALMARGILASAEAAPLRLLGALLGLGLTAAALAVIEMRLLRRVHWEGRPFAAGARESWLAPAFARFGGRPARALFLKELHGLLEIKSVRLLAFFVASYLPIFVLFAPPPNYLFAQSLFVFPLFMFSQVKGNLLGSEHFTRKACFASPVDLFEMLRMKNRVLNLLTGGLLGGAWLIGWSGGRLHYNGFENAMLALCALSVFLAWDLMGFLCSVLYPEPTDLRGVMQGTPTNAGGFLMVFGLPVLLALFVLLEMLCARAGHPRWALVGGAAIALTLAATYRGLYLPWLRGYLRANRETLYRKLAEPVA